MYKGSIFFNNLAVPFDLIIKIECIASIIVFIPYSDEDILLLIENGINLTVVEDTDGLKGKYLRVIISLSDIKSIIFEYN